MKIGVIQASSQAAKNNMLFEYTRRYADCHEVVNFGCFPGEETMYSYVESSILIGLLLNSGALDFVVTGCSSGQGMMLACNTMPNVICGYAPTPMDAYLFAQINDGNAISLPLGEDYTYSGENNCRDTIKLLFSEPFGQGYPKKEAQRKLRDTELFRDLKSKSHMDYISFLEKLDAGLIDKVLARENVIEYLMTNSRNKKVNEWIYLQKIN